MKEDVINLFKNGKNPLENDKTIEQLAKAYTRNGWFYDEIVKIGTEDKEKQEYPIRDMDILYSSLFNLWKHNILDTTNVNEIKQLLQDDFNILVEILRNMPDIHTYQEFCDINKQYDLIKKYGILFPDNHWTYLSSRYLNGTRKFDMEEKYRFYINTNASDLYKIVSSFIVMCYKKNLPFDLKMVKYAEDLNIRADSIVIWSDDKTLPEYLKFFEEFQAKRDDITSRCKQPPILTMHINGWIGFGEEPPESSYTDYRQELLKNSIQKAIIDWIIENENTPIRYGESNLSVKEYITAKSVKKSMERWIKDCNSAPHRAVTRYGMSKDGFNTDFYYKMCETMKDKVIPALKDGEDKMEYLGKTKTLPFFFRSSMIDICNMLIKSPNSKGEFLDSIRNNIKNGSKQYDISSKNFAFSIQSEKDAMETKNLDR